MLISGRDSKELRVAIVDEAQLDTYQVQVGDRGLQRGNVYLERLGQ